MQQGVSGFNTWSENRKAKSTSHKTHAAYRKYIIAFYRAATSALHPGNALPVFIHSRHHILDVTILRAQALTCNAAFQHFQNPNRFASAELAQSKLVQPQSPNRNFARVATKRIFSLDLHDKPVTVLFLSYSCAFAV